MPLSEEALKKLITPNAKALSSPKGDQYIDEGRISNIDDFDDSMFLAESYQEPVTVPQSNGNYINENALAALRARTDYSSNDFNPNRIKSTRMNTAILEDMVKHPIDTRALNPQTIESAGNGNAAANNDRLSRMVAGAKLVEEKLGDTPRNSMPTRQTQQQQTGGGIDYALIKTIVNEAIENKLNEIMECGELRIIRFNKGKLKLIDNSGNIFSAPLKLEGNIKDKKQGGQ